MSGERQNRVSWEQTAINLAYDISIYRSPDPYTQVGACAIKKEGFQIAIGYNGAPSGLELNWQNREEKNKYVCHAETNVLNSILPGEVLFLAVTHLPCKHCLIAIRQKKIFKVYYSFELEKYNPEDTKQMAKKIGVELIQLLPTSVNFISNKTHNLVKSIQTYQKITNDY